MKLSIRLLGLFLGVSFLIWSFAQVNLDLFFLTLTSMNPAWAMLGAVSLFLSLLFRSFRWHILTGLPNKDQSKVWEATCIGYLGTAIYPARAGDVMRMLRLQELTGLGGGLAIGSGVIDRILEGLGLGGLLLVLILSWKVGLEASQGLIVVACLFLAAAVGATVFVVSGHRLQGVFDRLSGWCRWGVHLKRWYEQSLAGLQVLRSPRRLILAFSMQGLVSLFDVLACWLLIRSFGWALPFMVGAVVLVYIAAAASLPSSPGYVGVYQIATLFALRPYEIDDSSSVAYGTVLQVLTLILFICSGSWAILKQRARNHHGKIS